MRTLDGKRFSVETGPLTPSGHDVVLAATDQPLAPRQASALGTFVRRGGALVVLHSTLDAWLSSEAIAEMAGWTPGGLGPLTELVVHPDRDHPVTQRLDGDWKLSDELYLSEGPPVDASVLLRARRRCSTIQASAWWLSAHHPARMSSRCSRGSTPASTWCARNRLRCT